MKKRVIALVLLCCFLLTACGGTGTVVEEVIWNNETFNDDGIKKTNPQVRRWLKQLFNKLT